MPIREPAPQGTLRAAAHCLGLSDHPEPRPPLQRPRGAGAGAEVTIDHVIAHSQVTFRFNDKGRSVYL
jgi:hypothetical protein